MLAPTAMAAVSRVGELEMRLDEQAGHINDLGGRIAVLEDEVQEHRRMSQRIGELTDIVAEVLLPAAERDDDRLRQVLDRYREASF